MNELKALSLILQTPKCLPALIWGDFGIGKTARVDWLVKDVLQWELEILRPAERGEGALGVVPVPSEDRSVLHYPMPDWAARFCTSFSEPDAGAVLSPCGPEIQTGRNGVIFLDEISSTPPALQPAIMGLALDGIIAGKKLPSSVRRIAAGNPVDQAAGGWDLAPALANRFVHMTWGSPPVDEWSSWLMGHPVNEAIVKLDLETWEKEYSQARALGAAFIRSHPSALHEDVGKAVGRVPPAYATPRTWECAIRLLATCRATQSMELYPMLASGALGPGVALEGDRGKGAWLIWLKDNDLPDPEDLLKNPELFDHDPHRPDRSFATLLAVAEASVATVNGKKLTEKARSERWNRAWEVMDKAIKLKIGKDIVMLPARLMTQQAKVPKGPAGEVAQRLCIHLAEFLDISILSSN